MKYILFLKDDTAIAKGCCKSVSNIDIGVYDKYAEITFEEYNAVELPCKKINDVWVKVDEVPKIEYPTVELGEVEQPVSEIEQLRADIEYLALMTGVTL